MADHRDPRVSTALSLSLGLEHRRPRGFAGSRRSLQRQWARDIAAYRIEDAEHAGRVLVAAKRARRERRLAARRA